ncbi:MAG TPA: rRNA maturation RNase YbeY [Saprospiraceae bacterium]|nr:rRNA maturation RNase YbeY [Saprospiraceae bacterium]
MEDIEPFWPEPEEEDTGIFFTIHDVDLDIADPDTWTAWIRETIDEEGYELTRIDYIFCSDEFLLEVNRTHLDHDFYTDIITFPLNPNPIVAEIYISVERVKENARQFSKSFPDELHRVMIHGILHLCGYEDHEDLDVAMIRKKEEYYLKKLIPS